MQKTNRQNGFTIFETLIVLVVMIAVLASGATWMKQSADNNQNRSAAENLMQLTTSVQLYARDNFATLISADSSEIGFDPLIKGNYINKTFSQKNSYGQTYKIAITSNKDTAGDNKSLQILISTQSGDVIKIANMRKISSLAGSAAGYAELSGKITGNQKGWYLDAPINKGHLATVSYVSAKDVVSAETFLRRSKFDGHPEWNQMETDLDMQSNAIVAASDKSKSRFSADVLTFDNGSLTATLSPDKGLSLENGGDKATVNTKGVKVESSGQSATLASNSLEFTTDNYPVAGLRSFMPSNITSTSVKPAFFETEGTSANDVWKTADDICKNDSVSNIGRLLAVTRKNDREGKIGLFICGKKDGKQKGAGRAYLVSAAGDNNDNRTEGKNVKYNEFVRQSYKTSCVAGICTNQYYNICKKVEWYQEPSPWGGEDKSNPPPENDSRCNGSGVVWQ